MNMEHGVQRGVGGWLNLQLISKIQMNKHGDICFVELKYFSSGFVLPVNRNHNFHTASI